MMKKVLIILSLLVIFMPSIAVSSKGSPCADISDLKEKRVVKSVQVDSEIYNLVTSWIRNIDNYCGKISPVQVEGYKIRIPFDPPVKVRKQSLNATVSEVYIIVPPDKPPFFIIFEDKNRQSYFKFHGNIDSLSKVLDFKLRN